MSGQADERLACGTELGALIDEVADGPDPGRQAHERRCPHCQPALTDLRRVWGQVRELAEQDVNPPERLVARVIDAIRRQGPPREGTALALEDVVPRLVRHARWREARGTTRIADAVVAEIAARAARRVAGVHDLARGAARTGVAVEVDGRRVTVGVRLIVDYRHPDGVSGVTVSVRDAVIAEVEALTGLSVAAVDVAVDDLHT